MTTTLREFASVAEARVHCLNFLGFVDVTQPGDNPDYVFQSPRTGRHYRVKKQGFLYVTLSRDPDADFARTA